MKVRPGTEIERFRVRSGRLASDQSYGNSGTFRIPGPAGAVLLVIVSDGAAWEHVSVSPLRRKRTPTWEEMSFVKDLFWDPEEVVIQFHPARSQYVNNHPFCLHMWRPIGTEIPTPPSILVGVR